VTDQQVATVSHSRQPDRQAGQTHRQRGRSPSTDHAVEDHFWRCEAPPRTDMSHELWLYIYKVRAPHIRGERWTPLRVCAKRSSAVFGQVVFITERDHENSSEEL
jgi:hypothetical protein